MDLNTQLEKLRSINTPIVQAFGLDAPLPYSSVRRKLELKRRQDVFKKALVRKKISAGIRRMYKRREGTKLRTRAWRERGAGFTERVAYYESLEKSRWYYLKRRYGLSKILTLEEFEEHIAPRYTEGVSKLIRKDKSRKDFFLDNIEVLND